MSSKPSEIYQGSDWLTYRWTVAQAFDTLDRIRDLCLQMPVNVGGASVPAGQPRFDIPEEDIADMFGVIPQVIPLWSSFILYRLETNVRSATTLGIVGAGGIGQTLYESIRAFQYAETAAQLIAIMGCWARGESW